MCGTATAVIRSEAVFGMYIKRANKLNHQILEKSEIPR